jgi:predicted dehydrogenase
MQKIRYGIIGCGSMGREHIENLRAMGGATVTAIADPSRQSREQAAAIVDGKVELFADHKDLLKSGLCDALVVASPNFTHIEVMRDALATDQHILCEKPLVTKVADGVEMIERAKGRKGIVWVASARCTRWRSANTVSPSIRRSATGTASPPTPAAPWSRNAATTST